MEDTYKGESPSKKWARFNFWAEAAKKLGKSRFYAGKHLVLASREGGDVSILLGLGVPARNIIPVDLNPKAALAAQDKFPDVKVIVGDVADIAKEYKRELSSAFLDFCAPMDMDLLQKVKEVVTRGLANDAVLGCAFLNGREKDEKVIDALRDGRAFLMDFVDRMDDMTMPELIAEYHKIFGQSRTIPGSRVITAQDMSRVPHETLEIIAKDIRENVLTHHEDCAFLIRTHFLAARLMEMCGPFKCAPYNFANISYMSNTRRAKGVPMFIYIGQVMRAMPGASPEKFKRKFRDFLSKEEGPHMRDCNINEDGLRALALDYVNAHHSSNEAVALLFNVPKQTIAAWKAHETRGTYIRENV